MSDSDEEHFTLVQRDAVPGAEREADETPEQRKKRIVRWLDPTDYDLPGNEYRKHLHAHVPGTGEWASQYPAYRAWCGDEAEETAVGKETDSGVHVPPPGDHGPSCLHVKGVAGSGKSVFAASTIQQLQQAGHAVLFFFFRQIVDKNHAAKHLIRDLAAQMLLRSDGDMITEVLDQFSTYGAVEDMSDVLWSTVRNMAADGSMGKRTFIVVDALDEMDDDDFAATTANLLEIASMNPDTVRVMFTARPLPKVEQAIQDSTTKVSQLKLDPAILTSDVARYVESRMAALEPKLSSDKSELVSKAICERANGLFLLARLVTDNLVENLQDGRTTEETLPDSLERLPRSLSDVYEQLLQEHSRRSGVTVDQQAKILACVTHSSHPLRLIQLGSVMEHMLKIPLGEAKDVVRASCGRLLELLPDESVSIIHHSFTEFLGDESRKGREGAFPVLDGALAHDTLAAVCFEYLDACPRFDVAIPEARDGYYQAVDEQERRMAAREKLNLDYPLADYAAHNCIFHLAKSGNPPSGLGLAAVSAHLAVGHAAFENLALTRWDQEYGTSLNPLLLVLGTANFGRPLPLYLIRHLLDSDASLLDASDPMGRTPLIIATSLDRGDIVTLLLSKGAKADITTATTGLTALHIAVKEGHVSAAKALLEGGVDPQIKATAQFYDQYEQPSSDTALFMAMESGNSDMAQLFIPFMPADDAAAFFHKANGPDALEAILKTGCVDVNSLSHESRYGVPRPEPKLWAVVREGNNEMTKILLDHGASATRDSKTSPTALFPFVNAEISRWEGEDERLKEMVQMLVDAGADVNAKPTDPPSEEQLVVGGTTVLHLAVSNGRTLEDSYLILTDVLLKAGADATAADDDGNTPAHMINLTQPNLWSLLVEHGADINAKNKAGRTPLLEIVRRMAPHLKRRIYDMVEWYKVVEMFQLAVSLGADLRAVDNEGSGLFHYVLHSIGCFGNPQSIETIELALQHGDLSLKNHNGETPIFWYKRGKPLLGSSDEFGSDVLELLMEKDMRLDEKDKDGLPLLHHLMQHAHLNVDDVKLLMALGADPTSAGPDGKSLFRCAAQHSTDLDLLLHIAGIPSIQQATDRNGNNLIHDIVSRVDDDRLVRPLLECALSAGVSPLAVNHNGQSALHLVKPNVASLIIDDARFHELDVNGRDAQERTPLHSLAAGAEDVVASMVERGADPLVKDKAGFTPLHCAAKAGAANVVGYLLAQLDSKAATSEHVNSLADGLSPLHYACEAGTSSAVEQMLRAGADPNLATDKGLMPLHMVTKFTHERDDETTDGYVTDGYARDCRTPEIVQSLHRHGAKLEAVAEGDKTALDLAVEAKRWEVVRELMTCGAAVKDHHKTSHQFQLATDKQLSLETARKMKAALDAELEPLSEEEIRKRPYHHHPLPTRWIAAADKAPENANGWILGTDTTQNLAAPPNWPSDLWDVFVAALRENDFDTIREHVEQGGETEQLAEGAGCLPWVLIQSGHYALLRYFAKEHTGPAVEFTPRLLTCVSTRGPPSMEIVELLVNDMSLDLVARPTLPNGGPALNWPVHLLAEGQRFWHLEALDLLLSKGAKVDQRADDGVTPILAAFDHRRVVGRWNCEAAEVLLKHGANINDEVAEEANEDMAGMTVLRLAKSPKAIRFLVKAGADVKKAAGAVINSVFMWMDVDTTGALLNAGLNPNEKPQTGEASKRHQEVGEEAADGEDSDVGEPVGDQDDNRLGKSYSKHAKHFALHYAGMRFKEGWQYNGMYNKQQAMVKLLVSRGADPFASYDDGSFVLQKLIEHGGMAMQCISALPSQPAPDQLNKHGKDGRTALIQACIAGSKHFSSAWYTESELYGTIKATPVVRGDIINALLAAGADASLTDDQGRTALHWMCTQRAPFDDDAKEAFEALLSKHPDAVISKDNEGRTPLHLALAAFACTPSMDFAIRKLMAAGGKIEEDDPVTGDSALHMLARRIGGWEADAVSQLRELITEVAKTVDINTSVNKAGETVAVAAVTAPAEWSGNYVDTQETTMILGETVAIMVSELGMKVDYVDAEGRNLLHLIVEMELPSPYAQEYEGRLLGMSAMFAMLMQFDVDPRLENKALRTPIDIASAREMYDIMSLFNDPEVAKEAGGDWGAAAWADSDSD